MSVRPMGVANRFYEGSPDACRESLETCLCFTPPEDLGPCVGGVVPHAGWVFSGATAGKTFLALKENADPQTVIVCGAVHRIMGDQPMLDGHDAWATPLGEVPVDADLGDAVMSASDGVIGRSTSAHQGEHSIEVQMPFVKHLFPEAQALPVAVPPGRYAARTGKAVAQAVEATGRRVVVVASTDLTHYGGHYFGETHGSLPGALDWMKRNDRRFIDRVLQFDIDAIVPEANKNRNACGAGATAAAAAASKALGATAAELLEYTTSYDVMGGDSAVGYAAIVFQTEGD